MKDSKIIKNNLNFISNNNSCFHLIPFLGKKKKVHKKILVMGDASIGKTSLLHVISSGYFPDIYEPTVSENHTIDVMVGRQLVQLSIWDTIEKAYQKYEKNSESPSSYTDVHVIMLCFSVDQPNSLRNTENQWLDEIIKECPGVKICLVGLKCDLRAKSTKERRTNTLDKKERKKNAIVEYEQGLATARRIRASRYLECSAKLNRGVTEAFLEVAKVSINSTFNASTSFPILNPNLHHLYLEDENQNQKNQNKNSCCSDCIIV